MEEAVVNNSGCVREKAVRAGQTIATSKALATGVQVSGVRQLIDHYILLTQTAVMEGSQTQQPDRVDSASTWCSGSN